MSHESKPKVSRRSILQGGAAVAATAMIGAHSGLGELLASAHKFLPSGAHPMFSTPIAANANIQFQQQGTPAWKVPSQFMGFSFPKSSLYSQVWQNGWSNSGVNQVGIFFQALAQAQSASSPGPLMLRVNGTDVDALPYYATASPGTQHQICSGDIDYLVSFLAQANCKVIYGLNLVGVYSQPPTVFATGNGTQKWQSTIDEALYVFSKLRTAGPNGTSLLHGFEIGNEPDFYLGARSPLPNGTGLYGTLPVGWKAPGYGWPAGHDGVANEQDNFTGFQTDWLAVQSAIMQLLPGVQVPFIGPAGGKDWNYFTEPWFSTNSYPLNGKTVELTQHYYKADGAKGATGGTTIATGLQDDPNFLVKYPDPALTPQLVTAAPAQGAIPGLPYFAESMYNNGYYNWRMDEGNSYFNDSANGRGNGFGAALWAIDELFTLAQAGCNGMNFMNTPGLDPTPLAGYSPVGYNPTDGTVVQVRPIFYGMMLFNMMGTGALQPLSLSVNYPGGPYNLTAWAVISDINGYVRVMLNNKEADYQYQVTITVLPGSKTITGASYFALTTPSSLADTTGTQIQQCSVDTTGQWIDNSKTPAKTVPGPASVAQTNIPSTDFTDTTVTVTIPPISAILLHIQWELNPPKSETDPAQSGLPFTQTNPLAV